MKKTISIVIFILGIVALIDDYTDNFTKIKLLYASFNSEKYFEKDELNYNNKISSAGDDSGRVYVYKGVLKKNNEKVQYGVLGYEKSIERILTEEGNIPVWFCKIKGVERVIIRNENNLPKPYSFINSWFFVMLWILWIPSVLYLIKIKKQK